MTLKSQIPDDARHSFLNPDEFAEEITYTPFGGPPVSINAVIARKQIEADEQDQGHVLENQCEVYLANRAASGVLSVQKGKDTLSFPEQPGGSPVSWFVVDVINKDDGMWRLLVQK
jgi:hypothetical protein